MGIAIPNREAVREASQAFRNAVNVASDALLEAWDCDFAAADGGSEVQLGVVGRVLEFYFRGFTVVALRAIDVSVVMALAGDVAGANIPRGLSLDGKDERSNIEEVGELHCGASSCRIGFDSL